MTLSYIYDEMVSRGNVNLDPRWLRDESLKESGLFDRTDLNKTDAGTV